jgi:hypothetical protein
VQLRLTCVCCTPFALLHISDWNATPQAVIAITKYGVVCPDLRVLTRKALLPCPALPQCGLRVLKASGCANILEAALQLPLASPLQELWLNDCRLVQRRRPAQVAGSAVLTHRRRAGFREAAGLPFFVRCLAVGRHK